MKQLLVIAPHFPPTNAADAQRVRMYLQHFRTHGWDPTVLAVAPECVRAPVDPFLEESVPADVEVHRVQVPTSRWLGDTLGRRALWPLARALQAMLRRRQFDLAYLSTTQFVDFALGPLVLRRHRLPYVLDFQDPWRNDYYKRTGIEPPGGRLRNALAGIEARWLEPWCVRNAAGITAVSPDYPATLRDRYGIRVPTLTLPFGHDCGDGARAAAAPRVALPFDPDDGRAHWVYVGRGGRDMHAALAPLFAALRRRLTRDPNLGARLRLDFIGTSYAAADRAVGSLQPIIDQHGLSGIAVETPQRIAYLAALQAMQSASVLLVPSSDDTRYNPSKLIAGLAMGRPTLLLAESSSHAATTVSGIGGVQRLSANSSAEDADRLVTDLLDAALPAVAPTDPMLTAMDADALCARLCRYFDEIVGSNESAAGFPAST